jgi:hypothetical protein
MVCLCQAANAAAKKLFRLRKQNSMQLVPGNNFQLRDRPSLKGQVHVAGAIYGCEKMTAVGAPVASPAKITE